MKGFSHSSQSLDAWNTAFSYPHAALAESQLDKLLSNRPHLVIEVVAYSERLCFARSKVLHLAAIEITRRDHSSPSDTRLDVCYVGMYNFRAFRQVVVTFTIIWGEGFLPEVPQTCPKRFLCDFSLQVFSHEHHEDDFFGVTKRAYAFLQTLGAMFSRIFVKSFGSAFASPPPTPLSNARSFLVRLFILVRSWHSRQRQKMKRRVLVRGN